MSPTLSALFEEQAARTPDAPAVHHPDAGVEISYRELSREADRMAQALVARGLPEGGVVAVCLPQGVARVAAFLAAGKAGAAYTPMDPAHPAARHRFIAEDSGAAVVVTTEDLAGHFPGLPVLRADADRAEIAGMPAAPPSPGRHHEAAIIYYTSGTTGTPKGVLVPHRSIAHFLSSIRDPGLTPSDRMAQLSSPAFDASTFEIYGPLTSGGCLVIVPRDLLTDPAGLGEAVRRHGITTMFLATSVFHEIAATDPTVFGPLRLLVVGGEAMDPRRARDVLAAGPGRFLNLYGPTETTTFVIWHEITEIPDDARSVPIGRPMGRVRAHVLDEDGRPAREGELWLAGPCVALGYLNRPELSAAAFVPDPGVPGELMYRTGDRVWLRADGLLEFAGRTDQQVKIRGHRLELGEVEARLLAHPEVAGAAVAVLGEGAEARLAGFVVPARGVGGDLPGRLRAHLSELVPSWMVPVVTVIDRLPLTSLGKVDRAALVRLAGAAPRAVAGVAGVAGLTPLESWLAEVWTDLVGAAPAGPDDDFFAIGGHSVLVGRLHARVRSVLGAQPPMRSYYTHTKLSDQARMLREQDTGRDLDALVSALDAGEPAEGRTR
ncbi:non-ribosomal peptide synthetase [Nonomuraea sp. B12E4]|uniref:non-ribosomal peptide synthetase n=1 Tax=Nonomuraea sp. B12E4 TaxID=3153564 RepID=UPI00325F6D22